MIDHLKSRKNLNLSQNEEHIVTKNITIIKLDPLLILLLMENDFFGVKSFVFLIFYCNNFCCKIMVSIGHWLALYVLCPPATDILLHPTFLFKKKSPFLFSHILLDFFRNKFFCFREFFRASDNLAVFS